MIKSFFSENFPFWQSLSENDRTLLVQNTFTETYLKGEAVHDGGECSGLFVVASGRLRIYMLSEDGKEITLYRLSKGEVCMLSASCVIQSITFDVSVSAEEDTVCYRVSPMAFGEVLERCPDAKIYALETTVTRFSDVMWVMQQILFMSMDKRLAIFLLDESQSIGSDSISMTHEQIARHLGTAREVITRILKHLSSDGIIEVTRGGIVITDKKRLRKIAY